MDALDEEEAEEEEIVEDRSDGLEEEERDADGAVDEAAITVSLTSLGKSALCLESWKVARNS
jgi:hypothetical protein